ncbi:uncharacterized protein LOC125074868 [Vanessa atalanta]|uniref:uncharacterized protein LOC125074868 n=1 Tax=Vanessa atalanta TaxID=42275 RepID=UPI001FCCC5F1|nr:uncharacterized protein LOC125074868 [Vanessa atalanta]
MSAMNVSEPWYLRVCDEFDAFCKKVDDRIDKQQQQLKACKKRNELENKLAQELTIKNELTQQLSELSRRGSELERVCAVFESRLTITDSDQHRLDNAKESYQLAKELTGIRLDFSAPPNIAKGYVKNEARRLLLPFEMESNSDALWDLVKTACDPTWPDKENHAPNKI